MTDSEFKENKARRTAAFKLFTTDELEALERGLSAVASREYDELHWLAATMLWEVCHVRWRDELRADDWSGY